MKALFFATAALLFSALSFAGPIEALDNGKFQVRICDLNGNQLGKDRVFNFKTRDGRHVTGGRTNANGCVVTRISNVRSGDTLILEVAQRDGDLTRGSFTVPRADDDDQDSLRGYCRANVDFSEAKAFAYGREGLDMNSQDAAQWAENYGRTHRCNTIADYKSRFMALYSLAYDRETMDMTATEAREYARSLAEDVSTESALEARATYVAVKSFVYNRDGLDRTTAQAQAIAKRWIENRRCERANRVTNVIAPEFKRLFDHAYSRDGLDLTTEKAREYAIENLESRCAHLLEQ